MNALTKFEVSRRGFYCRMANALVDTFKAETGLEFSTRPSQAHYSETVCTVHTPAGDIDATFTILNKIRKFNAAHEAPVIVGPTPEELKAAADEADELDNN